MFVKNKLPGPPGCNPLNDEDRMPVLKVVAGDTWTIDAELVASDGGPALPGNSNVDFILSENQFSPPMWTGGWFMGILPDRFRYGLVHVKIPRDFTKTLRRGSYMFSMRVSDKLRNFYDTQLYGNFLVEYMPTSEHGSIPYRDGTSEIFQNGDECLHGGEKAEDENGRVFVRDPKTGLSYELTASKDSEREKVYVCVGQKGRKL